MINVVFRNAIVLALGLLVTRHAEAQERRRGDDPTAAAHSPPALPPPGTNQTLAGSSDERDPVNEGAPVGQAAPPTTAGRTEILGSALRAGLEVFTQYGYRNTKDATGSGRSWAHAFDTPRVHGAIEGRWKRARGRIVLEATRLADDTSQTSSTGDGLVLRVREAWGAFRLAEGLDISAGVIPTMTIPELDGTWMLRPIAPSGAQTLGLMSPADIGAKVRFDFPHGYGWIASAAYNGEGYNNRVLNKGQAVESAIELHPLAATRELVPFAAYAALQLGTATADATRSDRFTVGPLWQGSRIRVGALATWAYGVGSKLGQKAIVATTFVRLEPVPRVLLGARFDHVVRNLEAASADSVSTFWGTVGYRVALPIETFLAFTRAIATTRAESEVKGSDLWELRLIGRVVF